jgi:hypothetical protein
MATLWSRLAEFRQPAVMCASPGPFQLRICALGAQADPHRSSGQQDPAKNPVLEAKIAVGAFLDRFPEPELLRTDGFEPLATPMFYGPRVLPMRL